jgi:ribosomal protein L17
LTPKEMAQVIRQYSLIGEGVKEVKHKVHALVQSRTKEEYEKTLSEIQDMVTLAERDANAPQSQVTSFLKSNMDFSNSDIKSTTDRAKMVEKRINDMYELQEDKLKRTALRQIRQANKEGNTELANKLQEEWMKKYGRR